MTETLASPEIFPPSVAEAAPALDATTGADVGAELIPHTDAWRRAQAVLQKRQRKAERIVAGVNARIAEAATARVPNVEMVPGGTRLAQRTHLREARRHYTINAPEYLNRRQRRANARQIKLVEPSR